MRQRLKKLIEDQVKYNAQIYPDWHERNLDFKTAVWAKCPVLLSAEHWEWWISSGIGMYPMDWRKAEVAAVEIFCFLVGWLYVKHGGNIDLVIDEIEGGFSRPAIRSKNTVHIVQTFAAHTLINEMPSLPLFSSILLSIDLNFDRLCMLHPHFSVPRAKTE